MPESPKYPLTPRALGVLKIANDEALRDGSSTIRPRHILCGLACEREGVAAYALGLYGLDRDIRNECASDPNHSDLESTEQGVWSAQGRSALQNLRGRAQTIFDQAVVEAERLYQILHALHSGQGKTYEPHVGTEHLLLAILKRPSFDAHKYLARKLRSIGWEPDDLVRDVLAAVGVPGIEFTPCPE
jgi:hypothetical protein